MAGGIVLYFISGYGLTAGFISSELANRLHIHDLAILVLIAFTIHTSIAIHFALKRWGVWNSTAKFILVSFYVLFLGFFVYMGNFYHKPEATAQADKSISRSNESNLSTAPSSQKVFTLSELSKYNGQNGQPAYVAVDGVVYDLSSVFVGGYHFGYQAGQDLSAPFHGQHMESILNRYPVVGTLKQ